VILNADEGIKLSDGERASPNRSQALVVWGLGTLFLGLGLLTAVMFGVLAEQVREQLGVSDNAIGLLSAVYYLAYSAAQFAGGILLDRASPRWVLGVSSLISAVACFLLADASSLGAAVFGRALLGIGLSTSFLGAIYLARLWFPPDRFASISAITQLATNLALAFMLIGLAVTGAIPELSAAMIGMGVGYVLLAIVMLLWVRRPSVTSDDTAAGESIITQLRTVVRLPQFWLGTVCFSSVFGALLAWNDLWGIMNQRAYGRSIEVATALNSTIAIAAGVGGLLLGWMSDRLGKRSLIVQLTIWPVTVVMALVLFLPRLPIPGVFTILFVFGFLLGGNILGFAQIGQHLPETVQATGFGLMTTIGFLTGAALDFLVGALVGEAPPLGTGVAIGHYRQALIPLLVVLGVGAVCAIALKDHPRAATVATAESPPAQGA
jgi:nitrate/nitrite transporter NarK